MRLGLSPNLRETETTTARASSSITVLRATFWELSRLRRWHAHVRPRIPLIGRMDARAPIHLALLVGHTFARRIPMALAIQRR